MIQNNTRLVYLNLLLLKIILQASFQFFEEDFFTRLKEKLYEFHITKKSSYCFSLFAFPTWLRRGETLLYYVHASDAAVAQPKEEEKKA